MASATIAHTDVFAIREFVDTEMMHASDTRLVDFYLAHAEVIEVLAEEGDADARAFIKTAERAQDRLNEAAQAEGVKERRQRENRQKLAVVLEENGYTEASAIISLLGEIVANKVAVPGARQTLGEALTAGGGGIWTRAGWAVYYKTLRPIAEAVEIESDQSAQAEQDARNAQEAEQKSATEEKALFLLGFLLRALSAVSNDSLANDGIRGAEIALERSKPAREWSWWLLSAVDRLIARGELVPWQ